MLVAPQPRQRVVCANLVGWERGLIALADKSGNARNQLLARLPRSDYKRLQAHLEPVPLHHRQVLCEAGAPFRHAYFPQQGVVSLLALGGDGSAIEVALTGAEGMVGLPLFLGDAVSPWQVLVQAPGEALRLSAEAVREECARHGGFQELLGRYTSAILSQTGLFLACNALHSVKQRCCRWLLMMHERGHSAVFPMTQEFLAQMLGVRRASVAEVAGTLQRANVIHSSRGTITILNRRGLEALACDCFRLARAEYERLLPPS